MYDFLYDHRLFGNLPTPLLTATRDRVDEVVGPERVRGRDGTKGGEARSRDAKE